jgi:hypothetical protein
VITVTSGTPLERGTAVVAAILLPCRLRGGVSTALAVNLDRSETAAISGISTATMTITTTVPPNDLEGFQIACQSVTVAKTAVPVPVSFAHAGLSLFAHCPQLRS